MRNFGLLWTTKPHVSEPSAVERPNRGPTQVRQSMPEPQSGHARQPVRKGFPREYFGPACPDSVRPAHSGSLSRNFTAGIGRASTRWTMGVSLFAPALAFPNHNRDGKPVCAGDAVGWAVRSSRGSGRAGPLRGGWRRRAWRLRRRGSCGLCRGSGPRVSRFHRRGRRLPRVPGRRLRGG